MRFGLTATADSPSTFPISLAQAKAHLRVDFSDDDDLIQGLIEAATEDCEAYCNAAFVARTYVMTLGGFPGTPVGTIQDGRENPPRFGGRSFSSRYPAAIMLPVRPLISVASIAYRDGDNATQTVSAADYVVVRDHHQPFVVPASGTSWPSTYDHPQAVTVTFRAGFDTGIPKSILTAIKLAVGHLYEHREDVVAEGAPPMELPMGSKHWLRAHRMHRMP